ncbi:ABC transporter permease [Clostridium sp. BL-8]|uniref:ABC transporter permease n=1 Tax=Clostridium sp. BL-8 TaxID=349938 RepID=UPI00098C5487|nr:ABC transporter permease [Clostridium sp. BL-8]OOM79387.1 hypothetical protein CLOBL_17070 [Clostridium sp. BL-8]
MLGKLMKYEIKATGRTLIPLYVVLLAFAIINKVFIGTGFAHKVPGLGGIAFVLTILGYGFTMAAVFIVTYFVIIQRFYRNLLGDEGYLMNTLPVTTITNVTSKLSIAAFWNIISGFVAILSIIIMAFKPIDFSRFFGEFFRDLAQLYNQFGMQIYLIIFEVILVTLIALIRFISMIYASISIGHLFNKHRILSSFGAFIVLNLVTTAIASAIGIGVSNLNFRNLHIESLWPIHLIMVLVFVFNLIFFIAYFIVINYILKNKLNLE